MIEGASSGSGQLSSLAVRFRARCRRMSTAGARAAFAAGVALSGVLTISPTAPALLEGASLRASDAGSGASGLRVFAASFSTPPGLMVEYDAVRRDPDRSAAKPYGDGVPYAVRTPLADEQLFTKAPALVAAAPDQSLARASPHKISNASKPRAARARKAASLRVSGCSRCLGPTRHASPRRGNLFASLFSGDFLRSARYVRRGNRPSGVAQQRETPRLTVWSFRRT
jgi:hypothetical protein